MLKVLRPRTDQALVVKLLASAVMLPLPVAVTALPFVPTWLTVRAGARVESNALRVVARGSFVTRYAVFATLSYSLQCAEWLPQPLRRAPPKLGITTAASMPVTATRISMRVKSCVHAVSPVL